jgi:hypothetical protein
MISTINKGARKRDRNELLHFLNELAEAFRSNERIIEIGLHLESEVSISVCGIFLILVGVSTTLNGISDGIGVRSNTGSCEERSVSVVLITIHFILVDAELKVAYFS